MCLHVSFIKKILRYSLENKLVYFLTFRDFQEMYLEYQFNFTLISSVQFSRPAMSNSLQPHELQHARLPSLCNPMNCSTPGFPVLQQLPEPAQTHVHHIPDAIQPSHPLLSPSPPTFRLSQHQGLFQ